MGITILFTKENSLYHQTGLPCYGIKEDARNYRGNDIIIAHPPCRSWGKLRYFSKHPEHEPQLGINTIALVRCNGGIIEQPESSLLFPYCGCPLPGMRDQFGGWCLHVFMSWFGYKAKKRTMLYIVGIEPKEIPAYPLSFNAITHTLDQGNVSSRRSTRLKRLDHSLNDVTPKPMIDWLILVAKAIEMKKQNTLFK